MPPMAEHQPLRCSFRAPDDDFFCEKYQVWYAMRDCNYRVLHRTYEGCSDCFQGRVNLRRPESSRADASPAPLLTFPARPDPSTRMPLPGAAPRKR